jgi:hypothetical protein
MRRPAVYVSPATPAPRITRPAILPPAPTRRHAAVGRGQGTYLAALATNSCNIIATGCCLRGKHNFRAFDTRGAPRTGVTLGDAKLTTNMLDVGTTTLSAQ